MNLLQRAIFWCLLVFVLVFVVKRLWFSERPIANSISTNDLVEQVEELERRIGRQNDRLEQIRWRHENGRTRQKEVNKNRTNKPGNTWHKPIAVLIFVCDRASALKAQLTKLLLYRKSKSHFPIVVSQDCDNTEVANVVKRFGTDVEYVKHESGQKAKVVVPPEHKHFKSYYLISRHYRLGLSHIFEKQNFDSVIILEDDLDISPDFFEYFAGSRWLLDADSSLFCLSAWNDNGRPSLIDLTAHDRLYRSDFFPGLGWLMTKNLWSELGPQWPRGFWDDWIRDPVRRQNRSCIRPEISRTAMTTFGKKGASRGLFFNYYLKKIFLNDKPIDFTVMNLNYLLKNNYEEFLAHVYSLPETNYSSFVGLTSKGGEYRLTYTSMSEYTVVAKRLKVMADTKAGVPRTAYRGIVTCFLKGNRVFVAPRDPDQWSGYDPRWEAPPDVLSPIDNENEQP